MKFWITKPLDPALLKADILIGSETVYKKVQQATPDDPDVLPCRTVTLRVENRSEMGIKDLFVFYQEVFTGRSPEAAPASLRESSFPLLAPGDVGEDFLERLPEVHLDPVLSRTLEVTTKGPRIHALYGQTEQGRFFYIERAPLKIPLICFANNYSMAGIYTNAKPLPVPRLTCWLKNVFG